MNKVLDNPMWNALNSGNKDLALGNDKVKMYAGNVAPFVGSENYSAADFDMLYEMIPDNRGLAIVAASDISIPNQWHVINETSILQFEFKGPMPVAPLETEFIELQEQHIPSMISLAEMMKPGPFSDRTIDFGNYYGIMENNELAAMAGYRSQPLPYIEISAVCTHPNYQGRGYGGALVRHLIHKIIASSGMPFLHARTDNSNANSLYQKLGFSIRKEMNFYVFQKELA